MNRTARFALLAASIAYLLGPAGLLASDTGVPNPLTLEQALAYANEHPRSHLQFEPLEPFPRRQPLYLDCHRLAFRSTSGIDNARNEPLNTLLAPVAAQELEILARFLDVLLADLSFSRYDEAMAVAYVQYDRANARRELGQYSDLRVAELETAYQDVRQRRAASEAAQRLTRALLAQAMDRPGELPRDLTPPQLPPLPKEPPDVDATVKVASERNAWLGTLKAAASEPQARLIEMEVQQQVLELVLRLQALTAVAQYARSESAMRDLKLDESRALYEQEYTADLGFSMSQQTKARLEEKQVAYCQALAWAELNALQGKPVCPKTKAKE